MSRDASEGKGPQRRPLRRVDRRLEEVAQAVGGGYCRLHMPLKLELGVRETGAGHRLGALEGAGGGGGASPPFQCIPGHEGSFSRDCSGSSDSVSETEDLQDHRYLSVTKNGTRRCQRAGHRHVHTPWPCSGTSLTTAVQYPPVLFVK